MPKERKVIKKISREDLERFIDDEPYLLKDDYDLPIVDSLFLVIPYKSKYSKVEKAIKKCFKKQYKIHMPKDYISSILSTICQKVEESTFGIVILAGLKEYKKKKCRTRMNIPFEYGMLQVLRKPIMLISEAKSNFNIPEEFSDISNEQWGETLNPNSNSRTIEKRIMDIFVKFIPTLANYMANKAVYEGKTFERLPHPLAKKLTQHLKIVYESTLRIDFNI